MIHKEVVRKVFRICRLLHLPFESMKTLIINKLPKKNTIIF